METAEDEYEYEDEYENRKRPGLSSRPSPSSSAVSPLAASPPAVLVLVLGCFFLFLLLPLLPRKPRGLIGTPPPRGVVHIWVGWTGG
jgi:hypothetical protein